MSRQPLLEGSEPRKRENKVRERSTSKSKQTFQSQNLQMFDPELVGLRSQNQPQSRQVQQTGSGLKKSYKQVGSQRNKFLSEPQTCIEVPSLKKEYEEYGEKGITLKPIEIYLNDCQKYAESNLGKEKIDVEAYQFCGSDFRNQVISTRIIEQLQNDQNACDIFTLEDHEIATFFQTETTKLFTEILFYNQKQYFAVKTWQKVLISSKTQQQNEQPPPQAKRAQFAKKAQTKEVSCSIQDVSAVMIQEEQRSFYIKTIEFYTRENQKFQRLCKPTVAEVVFGRFDDYRLYDLSIAQNGRSVFFFKRIFNEGCVTGHKHEDILQNDHSYQTSDDGMGGDPSSTKLKLYVFDLETCEQKPFPGFEFSEQDIGENFASPVQTQFIQPSFSNFTLEVFGGRQFNIQFSTRFAYEKNSKETPTDLQFIKDQYISIQEYVKREEKHKFFMYSLNVSDNEDLIIKGMIQDSDQVTGCDCMTNPESDINRQVQVVHHIKDYRGEKGYTYFIVQNLFGLIEFKLYDRQNEFTEMKYIKRATSDLFQKIWNNNGIIVQRMDIKIYEEDIFIKNIEQYYFLDSRNTIQLLFPGYTERSQKTEMIERIAKHRKILQQDFMVYKKIKFISFQSEVKNPQFIQKIEHIRKVLEIPEIDKTHQLTYVQDKVDQILYISEPKTATIQTISLKNHNCQICKSNADSRMMIKYTQTKKSYGAMDTPRNFGKQKGSKNDFKRKQSVSKGDQQQQDSNKAQEAITDQFHQLCGEDHPPVYTYYTMDQDDVRANKQAIEKKEPDIVQCEDGTFIKKILPEKFADHVYINNFMQKKQMIKTYQPNMLSLDDDSTRQITLLYYQPSLDWSIFVFAVYNIRSLEEGGSDTLDHRNFKKSYIIVRKSRKDMERIFSGVTENGIPNKAIMEDDDYVHIIKSWDHVCRYRLREIKKYQFENIADIEFESAKNTDQAKEYTYQYRVFKLLFCQSADQNQKINFIPFIYQEWQNTQQNKLMVLDIYKLELSKGLSINPSTSNIKYLYVDKTGYNTFAISRTTDVYEEKDDETGSGSLLRHKQFAKFQVFSLYTEKLGRYSCQEYIISHSYQGTENITIGQKELIFSREMIQNTDWSDLQRSQPIPYLDKNDGQIKGCQLRLQMGPQEIVMLNLNEQDLNNTYTYMSQVMMIGQKRFTMREDLPEHYVMVVSAILRKHVIEKNIFEQSEAYCLLKNAMILLLGLRIPDLKFIVLNSFDDIAEKYFFQSQELLMCKTMADLCLGDPKLVKEGLEHNYAKECVEGSIIEMISSQDQVRKDTLKECNFYPRSMIISQDFNQIDTIERALKNNFIKSAKYILQTVFERINTSDYYPLIMADLPVLMTRSNQIDINEFYSTSEAERKDRTSDGFCNIEIPFKHVELPVFSNLECEYFTKKKFEDFHDIQIEIANQINYRDKEKLNKEKDFEVEHFYIDFQAMIMAEKIRNFSNDSEEVVLRFDDLYYATFLLKSGDANDNFYLQESVQKIIEFQFVQTKKIMKFIFHLYIWMYGIPISILLFTKEESIHQKCLNVALIPTLTLFCVEIIEMKYRGFKYFNAKKSIDLGQAFLFWSLQALSRIGIRDDTPFIPMLKLALVVTSVMKLMYYMRIFEEYGFLIQMIIFCIADLIPFIIFFAVFNFIFIICFTVIKMGIDPEVDEAPINSYIMKTALQAFRTTYGELGVPTYWQLLQLDPSNLDCPGAAQNTPAGSEPDPASCKWNPPDDFYKRLSIGMIWVLWFGQTFWMLVIMLNFLIGVINASYTRALSFQEIIRFRHKSELTEECCIYRQFFYKLPEYHVIVFTTSKNSNEGQKDQAVEIMSQINKFIGNMHKDRKNEEMKSINNLNQSNRDQDVIKDEFNSRFQNLVNKHANIERKWLDLLQKKRDQ